MRNKAIESKKLGILGGGQLGRMLIQAGLNLNLDINVLDPDQNAPCKNIAAEFTVGSLTDFNTVYEFGKTCDLITVEIENVNTAALKKLQAEGKKVFPQPEVIELIQDKRTQKQFYSDNNIPTANFVLTQDREDVQNYISWLPAVHKLGKEGYDGRGVQVIKEEKFLDKAFDAPGLLESLINFKKEISVIVARNESGDVKSFPVVELVFHPEANLVEYLFAPADISKQIAEKAEQIAEKVITTLDMVGLLAVEMFVTQNDEVLVNEVAPRPHNSGHQTIEANYTSQYEQHLRAVFNLPLGDTSALLPSAMVNLLGEDGFSGPAVYEGLQDILALKGVHVHLYGKKLTKPFRKMGHVTIVDEDFNSLKEKVNLIKRTLKVTA